MRVSQGKAKESATNLREGPACNLVPEFQSNITEFRANGKNLN